jgi:hypothetical protein
MKANTQDNAVAQDSEKESLMSRETLLESHPLMNKYVFETDSIRRFYSSIKFLIVAGYDSCSFGAAPRSGKTFAIRMIVRYLAVDFPHLPVYVFNVPRTTNRYTKGFLDRWLRTVKHPERGGQIHVLRGRIVERLVSDAMRKGSRKVLVLLDEAQNMGPHDLQFLKDIYNELLLNDVYLVTVSVGQQPDLDRALDRLSLSREGKENGSCRDLIPRFFGNKSDFRQLTYPQDVAAIFSAIDSQFLAGSGGLTWSQFFAPNHWDGGWRLAREVTNLSTVLKKLGHLHSKKISRVSDQTENFVAAGLLFAALRYFLIAMSDSDAATTSAEAGKSRSRAETWKAALLYAEFEVESDSQQRGKANWHTS